jgi:hypothetical protein
MSAKLYLTTAFHCNLAFSTIPPEQYAVVVDRCYWPMLELVDRGLGPLGIEISASTLRQGGEIDPSWLERISQLWRDGKIEVIGSGEIQAIFPLQPASVNARNLALGQREYERLLGRRPTTGYVNEQVYAGGLIPLYRDAGYDLLIVEWNNVAKYTGLAREAQYRPVVAEGPDDSSMTVWWNNSVAFQKLQRHAMGQLDADAYQEYILAQRSTDDRGLMVYGSDAEIFDYRPGEFDVSMNGPAPRGEWERISAAWQRLKAENGIEFVTPAEVVRRLEPTGRARLESPEYPLPTKKQEKYNVTRWAVSGRDNVMINTACERVARELDAAIGLSCVLKENAAALERLADESVQLWASDARTHTTEAKHESVLARLGWIEHEVGAARERFAEKLSEGKALRLVNPYPERWAGEPAECRLRLNRGFATQITSAKVNGRLQPAQLEDVSRYRDGSLRSGRLVLEPEIDPYGAVTVDLIPAAVSATGAPAQDWSRVTTESVDVRFLPKRGGAIADLKFPQLDSKPFCGTLEHGFYDDIAYAADFYTGHGILLTPDARQKLTDLSPAKLVSPADAEFYPIRIPLAWQVKNEVGEWWKIYHIYRRRPRVDLTQHIRLQETRVLSFRIGIVTLVPGSYDWKSLRYRTVNGGKGIEEFSLQGHRVRHDEPVSHSVSSSHVVGATEGWVDFSDQQHGLTVARRPDSLYSVPMIHHEAVDDTFFCRVLHSVGESDDTSRGFWRGHRVARFSLMGHGDSLDVARGSVRAWNRGLIAVGSLVDLAAGSGA